MKLIILIILLALINCIECACVLKYAHRWKDNLIPYEINLSWKIRGFTMSVMRDIESLVCVKFVPRNDDNTDRKYAKIFKGEGCYSYVGMPAIFEKKADVSIGRKCERMGIIRHELAHLLGMGHEQARGDRNDYIRVHREKLKTGVYEDSYKISKHADYFNTTFDFDSITLYSPNSAVKNVGDLGWERIDISDRRPIISGAYRDFSFWDIRTLNIMYKCEDRCKNKPKCNYPDFINQKCQCVSRESYADERCIDKHQSRCKRLKNDLGCYIDKSMNEYCRKTCGVCYRHKNHGKSERPSSCFDFWSESACKKSVREGKCNELLTQAMCTRTCKLKCTKPSYIYPFTACNDQFGSYYCKWMKSQNECIKNVCRKTCDNCISECTDKKPYCHLVLRQNRCSDLGTFCPYSCNQCPCVDSNKLCPIAAAKDLCPKVGKYCIKSCNKCMLIKNTTEECVDTKSFCKLVPQQNRCDDLRKLCPYSCNQCPCIDYKKFCPSVIAQKRCADFGKYCPKSCKKCKSTKIEKCDDMYSYCRLAEKNNRCKDLGKLCPYSCKQCPCIDYKKYCPLAATNNRCADLGKYCPKSCKKCNCVDTKSYCKQVLSQNRCGDLGKFCRKTCKMC